MFPVYTRKTLETCVILPRTHRVYTSNEHLSKKGTKKDVLCLGGRGLLCNLLYRKALPCGPSLYPFVNHFDRKGTPLT